MDEDEELLAKRARYRRERDKRLRSDGNHQYREMVGRFASWLDDPYADPGFTRDPIDTECEVLVVGGGIGGLVVSARLREAGVTDVRVIDKASDFGGTWYWNRYPGAMCDVESYIYLPLLEETGYIPTQKYATATEIREHLQRVARHLDLYSSAVLGTSVTDMVWNESTGRWRIGTDRGDEIHARFVVVPNGQLLRPKLPGIPGIEEFAGHAFHTSRWDYRYTGGDAAGGLTKLADRRVGIIGTGATAIQCIPYLGEYAERLSVFQRTPSAVDVRGNRPTDQEWVRQLAPGWQQERRENFTAVVDGNQADFDLVGDGWTAMFRELTSAMMRRADPNMTSAEHAAALEAADMRVMDRIRARIEADVRDPHTVELLKPWYGRWCKRPCFHDEYLATFNRPNVTLVDTDGRGPDRITANSVIVGDQEYPVDCLVFATGFEVGTSYGRRVGFEVEGRDGMLLSTKWQHGPRSLHGVQTAGFPNAFFTNTSHAARTANYTHLAEEQARHIAYIVSHVLASGATVVEVRADAEERWCEHVRSLGNRGVRYRRECTPGYYNGEGDADDPNSPFAGSYGDGPIKFFSRLAEWRAAGRLAGLDLRTPAGAMYPAEHR